MANELSMGKKWSCVPLPPPLRDKKKSGFWMNEGPMRWAFPGKKRYFLLISISFGKKQISFHGHYMLFHGHHSEIVTGTFCFSRAKFQKFHGHFSVFTGILMGPFSRAFFRFSRAKFGVFFHGHFWEFTGTFSKSVTGISQIVTGKKKHCPGVRTLMGIPEKTKVA